MKGILARMTYREPRGGAAAAAESSSSSEEESSEESAEAALRQARQEIASLKEKHDREQRAKSKELAQLKRLKQQQQQQQRQSQVVLTSAGRAKAANKARLVAIWTVYNPAKIPTADAVLSKYDGKEGELFRKLEVKYGISPGSTPMASKPRPDEKSCCENCSIC